MESDKPGVPVAHPANTVTAEDLKTVKTMLVDVRELSGARLLMSDLAGIVRAFEQMASKVGGMEKLAQCFDTLSDLGSH